MSEVLVSRCGLCTLTHELLHRLVAAALRRASAHRERGFFGLKLPSPRSQVKSLGLAKAPKSLTERPQQLFSRQLSAASRLVIRTLLISHSPGSVSTVTARNCYYTVLNSLGNVKHELSC